MTTKQIIKLRKQIAAEIAALEKRREAASRANDQTGVALIDTQIRLAKSEMVE